MEIKKFKISKPKKYTTKQGEEKTQWNDIGSVTEFHEGEKVRRIIEIPAIGLEGYIFPIEKKPEQATESPKLPQNEEQYEEINPDDIPF
jgi:hypothetical protein